MLFYLFNGDADMTIGICTTNGLGYWSSISKPVPIQRIELAWYNKTMDFGELRVYFDISDWDITKDGLIYTDPQWESEFKELLKSIGFSQEAANDVNYSEQGMQNIKYVSLDVGLPFIREAVSHCSDKVQILENPHL